PFRKLTAGACTRWKKPLYRSLQALLEHWSFMLRVDYDLFRACKFTFVESENCNTASNSRCFEDHGVQPVNAAIKLITPRDNRLGLRDLAMLLSSRFEVERCAEAIAFKLQVTN